MSVMSGQVGSLSIKYVHTTFPGMGVYNYIFSISFSASETTALLRQSLMLH